MFFYILVIITVVSSSAYGTLCPGGKQTCASSMTCCMLPSGQEGCCPYTNATCCADQVHCCPMGSTCLAGHCHDNNRRKIHQVNLLEHVQTPENTLENEVCGDGSQCPDGSTCCPMSNGQYGCCPLSGAVCCKDKLHCCPENTACDPAGFCHSKQVKVAEATFSYYSGKNVSTSCPGGQAQCPSKDTCCSLGPGQWGCCPMPKAVCCTDQQHCCPHGYRCDGSQCIK